MVIAGLRCFFASRQKEAGLVNEQAANKSRKSGSFHVLIFLAQRGLVMWGADEIIGSAHNGDYLGIIELLAKNHTLLPSHIRNYTNRTKGHVSLIHFWQQTANAYGTKGAGHHPVRSQGGKVFLCLDT